ncbi:MAG: hypothetical protein IT258_09670 [Saprospiraceae bacterium]|nr:hypothetical protein [Saprospiraceae bacterium]
MANIYDRIIKEIIEPALKPLAEIALGLRFDQAVEVEDKIQYTLEREADHLKMLLFKDKVARQLLHLEFHLPDEDIGSIMLLKKGMLNLLFNLKVLQYVIYLGDKKRLKNLKPFFEDEFTKHSFEVIAIQSLDYHKFLQSSVPEAVIWAILADYGGDKPELAIQRILQKVNELSKDKTVFGKHLRRLEVLSKLRKLQPVFIQISKEMAFTYDLKTDIRYKQGIEVGKAKGKKEGIAVGKAEGIEIGMNKGEIKKATTAATKMLKTKRFTAQEIADFLDVQLDLVVAIQQKLESKAKKK